MSFRYIIKEGFAGLSRARLAAFTSIFSLFIAVFLIGLMVRVGMNAYDLAQVLQQQVEVEVFLEELDGESTEVIRERLNQFDFVESLTYISKDSAAAIFREEFGLGGESMASLQFLPASFRLTIHPDTAIEEVDSVVRDLEEWEGVDEVKFNLALMQMLQSRIEMTALAGGTLALLVILAAIVLVYNTIRLTIYSKRELIRAMKLVGATNAFIRRPFLFEGFLQGVIAGLFACGLIYALFTWLVPTYLPQLDVLGWPFGEWYYLLGGMMGASILMGWWGSRWAARKFIRRTKVYI